MVTLKTLHDLARFPVEFFRAWSDPGPCFALRKLALLALLLAPSMAVQYQTLKRCKKWTVRWLPLAILMAALVIGEIKSASALGWDRLGWYVLTSGIVYLLAGDLAGVLIFFLKQWTRKRKNAA